MTQSSPSTRADAELDPGLRSPEQLAFALPLTAVLGVMIVVSAVATGGSAHLVAIAAVGGFAVCAVIPMALMEAFVGRPLRAALRQLRAARDGRPTPAERPFSFGLVGDLVRVAADIRAAHLNLERQGGALARYEQMVVAGDEAIRAFRLQSEELAASAASGETHLKRSAQSQFSEIADAIKLLRASLPGQSFEGSVERIETMLVYLAESMERSETRDKRADDTLGRLERAFADIPRVVARETETVGGSVANAALSVRNDLASAVADDKAAQARLIERFEGFETRVLARLADIGSADIGKFAELVRHEADSTRRALRERLEAGARAGAPGDEREKGRIDEVAADLTRVGEILVNVAEQLSLRVAALDRIADEALPAAQGALETATQHLDAAAAGLAAPAETPVDLAPVGEALATFSKAIGQRLEAVEARIADHDAGGWPQLAEALRAGLAERIDASETRLLDRLNHENATAPLAEAIAALQARLESALESAPAAFDSSEIGALSQKPAEAAETLAAAGAADIALLRDDLAALGEWLRHESEAQAGRLEATAQRVVAEVVGFERDEAGVVSAALRETAQALQGAIERLDTLPGASAIEDLQAELKALGEAHASGGATLQRVETQLAAFDLAALSASLAQTVETQADRLVAEIEAHDVRRTLPGADDLAELPARLESAATRIHTGAEALAALATRDGADIAALAEGVIKATETQGDRLVARLDARAEQDSAESRATREAVADLAALIETISQIEADRVIGSLEALDAGEREAVREALAAAHSLWSAQAARFEAGAAALGELDPAALRAEIANLGESLAGAIAAGAETLGARIAAIDAGPIELARRSLGAASVSVADSEARLNVLAARLDTGLAALAGAAAAGALDFSALRGEIGGVVEAVARAGAETATRFENISQSMGAGVAEGLKALSGAMGGLVQAGGRWGELSRQIEALAAAASERPDFDALALSLRESSAGAVNDAAQRFEETSRAQAVRLVERFAEFDRSVFGAMLSAFDVMTRDLAETRVRLDRSVEAVSSAVGREDEQLAALGAEFASTTQAVVSGAERIEQRLAALDISAVALGERAGRIADAEARLEAAAAKFEARAEALAAGAVEASQDESASWRAELKAVGATVAALGREIGDRFDTFVSSQNEQAQAFELKHEQRGVTLDRSAVAAALSMFRTMTRNFAQAMDRFEAAAAAAEARGGAEASPEFAMLRSELAAVGDQVSDALERLDGRLDGFAAAQAERLAALESRIVAAPSAAEDASAVAALRTVRQDLEEAIERFDAATGAIERRAETLRAPDPSAATESETLWALASAVGQNNSRLDALAREQAERFEGLESRLGGRGTASERGHDTPDKPDAGLAAMKQDLAAALGRLEQTAATLSAPTVQSALICDLRSELREVGATVADALAQFSARLDSASAPAGDAEAPGARSALAAPKAGATSAVAKVVLSLADSLDVRFSEIESTLGELSGALPSGDGLAKLAEQAADAAAQLKSGLSQFAEASAALAADMSAEATEAAATAQSAGR
jgi:hypothetical protein